MAQSDMRVSAAICREQQTRQLEISKSHPLESRKLIAAKASAPWALKARAAEKREAGILEPLEQLDAEIAREFADEAQLEMDNDAR